MARIYRIAKPGDAGPLGYLRVLSRVRPGLYRKGDAAVRIHNPAAGVMVLVVSAMLTGVLGCSRSRPVDETATVPPPVATPPAPQAAAEGPITVLAAASLTEAFTAVEEHFEQETGAQVEIGFGGSQELRTSLEQGNAADVFASANTEHIEALGASGLIEDDFEFAHNRLALIVPEGNPGGIESLADLADKDVRLVMAVEECPVGKYARKLLAACDTREEFGPDFSKRVLAHVVSEDVDVKHVLTKVTLGAADAAFVYLSDLTPEAREQTVEIPIPGAVQQVATYGIGIPTAASNPQGGRRFVEFVVSDAGRDIVAGITPIELIDSAKPPWMEG